VVGRVIVRLLSGLVPLGLSACVAHLSRDQQTNNGYEYRPPVSAYPALNYVAAGPVELRSPLETLEHHDVIPLSYFSSGTNGHAENQIEGLYLRSRLPGTKKLLIVLPIWGSHTYPPEKISYGYAKHSQGDAHVIWLFGEPPIFPWESLWSTSSEAEWVSGIEDGLERYRTAIIDTRRLLDWIGDQSEIDPDRVGIVGFSMGALVAATVMGNDARISTGVYMMGGANYADVFAECRGKAGRVRRHAMQSYGWSLEAYHEFFTERMGLADPARYAGNYNPDKLLMIDARFDNCIPRSSREALWEATGHPERVTMLYRHKEAFYSLTPLGFNFARGIIYRFLDRSL